MQVVYVHIKFAPQSAQTFSVYNVYNADNGVVYFDNAVVFGYSVSWRVPLNRTSEIPHVVLQVLIPLDGIACSTNLLSELWLSVLVHL